MKYLLLLWRKRRLKKKLKLLLTVAPRYKFQYRWSKYEADCIGLHTEDGKAMPFLDGIVNEIHDIVALQVKIIDSRSVLSLPMRKGTEFRVTGELDVSNERGYVIVSNSLPMYFLGLGPSPSLSLENRE